MSELITDRRKEDLQLLDRVYALPYQQWDEEYKKIWTGELQPYYARDGWYDAADGMYLVAGDGNVRGAYNASDLNRVQETAEDTVERINTKHGITVELETLPVWTGSDLPDTDSMGKYIRNLTKIRDAMAEEDTIPSSMAKLNYTGANRIEQMLIDANERMDRIEAAFAICGDAVCGD